MKSIVRSLFVFLMLCVVTAVAGCGDGGGTGGNPPSTFESFDSKKITAFGFAAPLATGVISEAAKTISVSVPFGTDVTALVAVFTTTGVEATVGGLDQESGVTANDFTAPVVYTVTAEDDSTVDYTVTVTVAPNDAKEITAFVIAGQTDVDINGTDITVTMPPGTDKSSLTPQITHTGAGVSPASGTARNFTNPVVYTVTAADSSTEAYTVTVVVPQQTTLSFDFMVDGDALVLSQGSDWYYATTGSNPRTGNYANGYYMNQTEIAAPWLFTGDFTAEFEFYLKVLDDDYIYRYAFRLVDPNWSTPSEKYFDFAAYYTAFPSLNDPGTPTYYQTGQGAASFNYDDTYTSVPGVHSGTNTCRLEKTGHTVSVYMNNTFVRSVTIDESNRSIAGYAPCIFGHNSWIESDSNFYLRSVTIEYMDGEAVHHDWNE
ncbi:hypothetical protein [Desulfatiferula olefinivorans]